MSAPLDYSRIPDPWPELERELDREIVRLQRRRKWLITISVAATLVVSLICIGTALAHDAPPTAKLPQGWAYPFACCANYDCKQATGNISERPEGYVIAGTGEVVPYGDKRIKDSPDGEFHWCSHQSGLDAGKTICLFVPPRGM